MLVRVGILAIIVALIILIVNIVSGLFPKDIEYKITNEHLKDRVVQGIQPGDLIDVKNSLPLQITAQWC